MERLVDVYVYRREQERVKVLLLKRAPGVIYEGQWRMVAGKVRTNETACEAALRELKEETGLAPKLFWTLPSINQFYDARTDQIQQIPAFAAECGDTREIVLNHEHVDKIWISGRDIPAYVHWPEQRRLIHLLISIVTKNKLLDEWILQI